MAQKDRETEIYVAYEDYVPFNPADPEKNLLSAILIGALEDLKRPGDPGRGARHFFLSDDDSYIFSFQSICNHLNIDPKVVLKVAGFQVRGNHATPPPPAGPKVKARLAGGASKK